MQIHVVTVAAATLNKELEMSIECGVNGVFKDYEEAEEAAKKVVAEFETKVVGFSFVVHITTVKV